MIEIKTSSGLPGIITYKEFKEGIKDFDLITFLMSLQRLGSLLGNQSGVNINIEFEFYNVPKARLQPILLTTDFISFLSKEIILNCQKSEGQHHELDLINLVHQYGNLEIDLHHISGPTDPRAWLWPLRATNHQWFYLRLPSTVLARYHYFFTEIFKDSELKSACDSVLGIDFFNLYKIGFCIYAGFCPRPDGRFFTDFVISRYTNTELAHLKPLLTETNMNTFISLFSVDQETFEKENEKFALEDDLLKKYEYNPLKRFPFIKTDSTEENQKLIIPSLPNFVYSFSEGLYYLLLDTLDKKSKDKLLERFGTAFQKYIGELIRYYNLDLHSRAILYSEQKYKVGRQSWQSADWLLISDEHIFQIECKKRRFDNYARAGIDSEDARGISNLVMDIAESLDTMIDKEEHIRRGLVEEIKYKDQQFINILVFLDEMYGFDQPLVRKVIQDKMKAHSDNFFILGCYQFESLCQHSRNKNKSLNQCISNLLSSNTPIEIDFLQEIYHQMFSWSRPPG